ncbi:MAG: hypothetical protein M3021_09825, partial [Actinomycetota bacterium]|nr:hypothetical protein [Actinomycetota bacterium]
APGSTLDIPPRLGAGAALAIAPLPTADRVTITAPPGPDLPPRQTTLTVAPGLTFADTAQLGLYEVRQSATGRPVGAPEWFAVNLLDRAASDVAPRASIALQGHPVAGTAQAGGTREVGPLLLALGALLLLLEWWLYHHGGRGLLRRLRPR